MQAGSLGALELAHSTLAPGVSALTCADNPGLSIELTRAICGDLTPGASAGTIRLTECIVDGEVSGRDVHVDASTIFGITRAQTLHASNSILLGKVTSNGGRKAACGSRICRWIPSRRAVTAASQNDATQAARVRPRFESVSFGEPAYAQLTGTTARRSSPAPTTREKWAPGISCRRRCACATCVWRSTSICDSGWRPACSSCRNNRSRPPPSAGKYGRCRRRRRPLVNARGRRHPPGERRAPRRNHEDCHRAEEADCAHIAESQMKGDFSRSTFRATNHYSQVRAQQGRGVLDAELNEQVDITGHIARRPRNRHHRGERRTVPSGDRVPEFPGQGRSGRQGSSDRARALLRRRHPV